MKLKQLQLSEGLIKVPERLEHAAMKGLTNAILSQMASDIEDLIGPGSAVNQFRLWARKAFPGSRITHVDVREEPLEVPLPPVTRKDFDPRYQKMIPIGTTPTPHLVLTTEVIGGAGEYDAEHDLIRISFARVVEWPWDVYDRAVAVGGEKGQRNVAEILARVADLITSLRGYLKHELMHYVQFNALQYAHGDQIDLSQGEPTSDDQYYSSQTEFDPQIEQAAANAAAWISKLERYGSNVDFRALASYLTGATSRQQLIQTLGTDKMIPPEPLKFFTTLQRVAPEKWKKAVRKFYITLANRLQ